MASNFPFVIAGTVFDTDTTTALASVKVTARNERSNKTISIISNSLGEYQLDAANFSGGYNDGDAVTVFVLYINSEVSEELTINISQGGVTGHDLTLVEVPASDTLRYFTVQDFFDFHHFRPGGENTPTSQEVVRTGTMVETEMDNSLGTRFSSGAIEIEVDDCDATTGWSGSTDTVSIAVTTTVADYRTRTGALDLGKSGTTEAFFHYEKSTLTQRSFSNRVLCLFVSLDSLSKLRADANGSAILVRYGTDSSNYYEKTFYKDDLITGYNLLFFKLTDREVTKTGAPTDSNMQYFRIRFDTTATSDTVTGGAFILDNIFLANEEHFVDEFLDTRDDFHRNYFLSKLPVDRMIRFLINRAAEGFAPVFSELKESDNEIKISADTGRVRIVDVTSTVTDGTRIFPQEGNKQVRATYLAGHVNVPGDIKKLAILMTARDLGKGTVVRSLVEGRDTATRDTYTVLDKQIDNIMIRYRNVSMYNT